MAPLLPLIILLQSQTRYAKLFCNGRPMTDTLKSICDQRTHLKNPQLDFIPSDFARDREILTRDLRELTSAAAAENEKTVVILAGGILEAILYSFIHDRSAR
jgi:hypothetical protein